MSEQPKQEWRIEIGRTGATCYVFCDGAKLTNVQVADLHLETGQPSTLHLKLAPDSRQNDTTPFFHEGDVLTAQGTPRVHLEIGGRKFRVMEIIAEGDFNDGLFGERRTTGNAHQPL